MRCGPLLGAPQFGSLPLGVTPKYFLTNNFKKVLTKDVAFLILFITFLGNYLSENILYSVHICLRMGVKYIVSKLSSHQNQKNCLTH